MFLKNISIKISFIFLWFLSSCGQETKFAGDVPSNEGASNSQPGPPGVDISRGKPIGNPRGPGPKPMPPVIPPPQAPFVLTKQFDAASVEAGSLKLHHDVQTVEQRITLQARLEEVDLVLRQSERIEHRDSFIQGSGLSAAFEEFNQVSKGTADILIVVDNSASMGEEQKLLADRLEPLVKYLDGSDWRIAITTTSVDEACIHAVIKHDDIDKKEAFRRAVDIGVRSIQDRVANNEMGFLRAVEGLKGECLPEPWIRSESVVATLIISDEDNCSTKKMGCRNSAAAEPSYLLDYMKSIRKEVKDQRVYGIYWDPSTPKSQCSMGGNQAEEYSVAVRATSGIWGSICAASYDQVLEEMSLDIATSLNGVFELSKLPANQIFKVYLDGALVDRSDFEVVDRTLKLKFVPKWGQRISVHYETGADNRFTYWDVDKSIDPNTLVVRVDGRDLTAGQDYDFDFSSRRIFFSEIAPDGASVEVRYREDGPLQKDFKIDPGVRNIRVLTDTPTDYSYDPVTGMVTLVSAPLDGEEFSILYEKAEPVLTYPLSAGLFSGRLLSIVDTESGEDLNSKVVITQNDELQVDESAFLEGRQIRVFSTWVPESNKLQLPSQVSDEHGIEVLVAGNPCKEFDWIPSQGELLINCNLPLGSDIEVNFITINKRFDTFSFEEIRLKYGQKIKWSVFVNEIEIKDYEVRGQKIYIENLSVKDKVRIRAEV